MSIIERETVTELPSILDPRVVAAAVLTATGRPRGGLTDVGC